MILLLLFYKNDVSSLFLSSRTDLIIEKLNKKHILFFHFFLNREARKIHLRMIIHRVKTVEDKAHL